MLEAWRARWWTTEGGGLLLRYLFFFAISSPIKSTSVIPYSSSVSLLPLSLSLFHNLLTPLMQPRYSIYRQKNKLTPIAHYTTIAKTKQTQLPWSYTSALSFPTTPKLISFPLITVPSRSCYCCRVETYSDFACGDNYAS